MEYIEREAAYRFAKDQLKKETGAYTKGWNNAMNVMKSAFHNNDAIPSANVVSRDCYDRLLAENDELRKERPVVRCGECKYSAVDDMGLLYCKCVTYYNHVPEDWYCADGERKDGDGE